MEQEPNDTSPQSEEAAAEAESSTLPAVEDEPSGLVDVPNVTSDAELTFGEALRLAGRRGARLVMLMGETGTGKTTVMVELWTHLVGQEAIDGYRCAGSRTVMALERRAFLSRVAAGRFGAETPRTQIDEDEGLLHLRVARPDGQRVEILFADYAGERFSHIREGALLLDELPWAPRVDRVAVLVDGSGLRNGGRRELAINSATRQVYALREGAVLRTSASLAVVVTKNDEVDEATFQASEARIMALLDEARKIDSGVQFFRVAARPADGSPPIGLSDLLGWLCADDPSRPSDPVTVPTPSRAIARLRPI